MPAVNIFLSYRRFTSVDELRQFVLSSNGRQAPFMQEVSFGNLDSTKIQLIHNAEASTVYDLLQGAPDFDRWGRKVRSMAGRYDTAILVYEPNLMRTPEGSTLYYVGRLVYQYHG